MELRRVGGALGLEGVDLCSERRELVDVVLLRLLEGAAQFGPVHGPQRRLDLALLRRDAERGLRRELGLVHPVGPAAHEHVRRTRIRAVVFIVVGADEQAVARERQRGAE